MTDSANIGAVENAARCWLCDSANPAVRNSVWKTGPLNVGIDEPIIINRENMFQVPCNNREFHGDN